MSVGVIFIIMSVISFLLVLWYYWSWFENNPTTEEIIKDSLDKHNL
ncbi:hypothetical protein [Escherichia phage AV124]|nr:hypothetical protein [Escherichia phage AV124]